MALNFSVVGNAAESVPIAPKGYETAAYISYPFWANGNELNL